MTSNTTNLGASLAMPEGEKSLRILIEPTHSGLRPQWAAHVKRCATRVGLVQRCPKSSSVSATRKPGKSSASSPVSLSTARQPKSSPKSAPPAGSSSSLSTSLEHRCAHCGSDTIQLKHVTRSFGKGANLLVIEGVPIWSGPRCGESYFTAKTMHEIERIKALRKSLAVKRSISVAAYAAADT